MPEEHRITPVWIEPDWPEPPRVRAIATTRRGGCSEAPWASLNLGDHVGDRAEAVARNRELLRRAAGLPAEPVWLEQVHGTDVIDAPLSVARPRADGAWTCRRGVVCAVMTADCLPVLISARDGSRVAAVHAGWRGLCAGVLEAALNRMGVPGQQLQAWIGPAISAAHYEVGAEVRDAFLAGSAENAVFFQATTAGHWLADLPGLARARLRAAGVDAVYGGGYCSYADADSFFSYRRDAVTGRMASLIWIDE